MRDSISSNAVTRRGFLTTTVACVAAPVLKAAESITRSPRNEPFIQTVLGPIPAAKLGRALAHEHVMCDFVGADQTGRHRWEIDAVVKRMQPVLAQLKERGFTGFFDCTPADRKTTRLNSSHVRISYAVFCLKKKKQKP